MVEPAALRQALADFLGAKRFSKFVREFRKAGRLRFWQEQEWGRFTAAHPEFAVSGENLAGALRICWLHGKELQPDTVKVIDGNADYADWYVRAKLAEFPCSESGPVWTEGAPFQTRMANVWFCPECRAAEAAWKARTVTGPYNRETGAPMWENLLRVDWARLTHAYGHARDVPKILGNMVSPDKKARETGWNAFWGALNHQGDFYDSTVAVIPFLIEAVARPQTSCRADILNSFRQRWLDAPKYGGDPRAEEPPGGTDEPTPMMPEGLPVAEPSDEAFDEEIDIESYRSMDLCAWQTGRAIQSGRPTFERLLKDPYREVAAAAAALMLLWPETRRIAKQTLVQAIEEEPEAVDQGRRILEFGVYADADDEATLDRWAAPNRPAEVRAAAGLTWAWVVNPDRLPEPAAAALWDCSAPNAETFARLPWEGVFHRGPWILPSNAAELILRLAKNKNKEIRWRAVQGLQVGYETAKHLSAAQVIPVLIEALSDRYGRIRNAAAFALSQRAESVLEIDPKAVPALIAALDASGNSDWGDAHSSLDNAASTCGHAARLLATLSNQLTAAERKQALASVERAIRRFAGKDTMVWFDTMGTQASQFLKDQLGPLRKPIEWAVPDLLESLAYDTKQDRRLSCEECDRRLADLYSRAPKATITAAAKLLHDESNRDAAIGAAVWLMTLGPAAEPALPALEKMTSGKLDSYAQHEGKEAIEFIRRSMLVMPDVRPDAAAKSGRHRIAFLTGMDLSSLDRHALVTELIDLLEHSDAYVRAGSAELLAKLMPTGGESSGANRLLEKLVEDDAAVEVGITGKFEFEGRIYHWRQERRSPRVSALYALFAMGRIPNGDLALKAMLAESVRAAGVFGKRVVPHRFPVKLWRMAADSAGGLSVADPLIRATRQQCSRRGWTADRAAPAAEKELAEIIRELSGRLV